MVQSDMKKKIESRQERHLSTASVAKNHPGDPISTLKNSQNISSRFGG